jgi:hypothetical protein
MSDFAFEIRLARLDDVPLIWQLQRKNLYSLIDKRLRGNGFVRIESSLKDIEDIVNVRSAIVAYKTKFVGYYLLAGCAKDKGCVDYLRSQAKCTRFKGKFLKDYSVGYGTQVCITRESRGKGLAQALFTNMTEMSRVRYDLLMGSVTKENTQAYRYNIENCGGIVVAEDKNRWYVVFDLG